MEEEWSRNENDELFKLVTLLSNPEEVNKVHCFVMLCAP